MSNLEHATVSDPRMQHHAMSSAMSARDLSSEPLPSSARSTPAVRRGREQVLGEEVVRLRLWGSDEVYLLHRTARPWHIGTSDSCGVRLDDARVAPIHAQLSHEGRQWWVRDTSQRGVRQDGVVREAFPLAPGNEIGIGSTVLIAESARTIALREFCARVLGWARDPAVVDHALRAIRLAMTRRAPLVLRGDGDLVPIAYALHRRMVGADPPFIVCDRRRRSSTGSVRAPANNNCGVVALGAASGGSLCVRSSRLPRDFPALLARLREPEPSVQLIVCLDRDDRGALLVGPMPIDVPPLRTRVREIPRIVEEYAEDAIAALGAPPDCLTSADCAWVVQHASGTLADIEKGTLRLVARRISANLGQAAELLGMAPVSLSRWLDRRGRPPKASH